jgi:nicotinamide-nucleotide amidase
VPYTDDAKNALLDVPLPMLERFTAVSAPVAEAMASGALARSQGDVALSITGFAGRGAPDEEPGLVYFALARRDSAVRLEEAHFGDIGRGPVRIACLRKALQLLQSDLA